MNGRSRVLLLTTWAILAGSAATGSPARGEEMIIVGVTADTCYTVTVDGVAVPVGPVCVDASGILAFDYDAPEPVELCFSHADGDTFHICPGECGIRPQEETRGSKTR